MITINKPIVVISKCLEFDSCRYDAQLITNKYIRILKEYINFIPICPEVEIGLGIPRDPIHIISNKEGNTLYQPSTKRDIGKLMYDFSDNFIDSLDQVDGFILKSRSPSCAISTAKKFPNISEKQSMGNGPGLFTEKIIESFPDHPMEEDKRLNDIFLREHFYTAIFTLSDFRNVKDFKSLYDFQGRHKLLFMTYNQTKMRKLGQIASNNDSKPLEDVLVEYYNILLKLFKRRPNYLSNINTQMHAFGYYKRELNSNEKIYFLEILDDYRSKKVPISAINTVLTSWNVRFQNKYLLNQSYFKPFPEGLIENKESRMK